MVDRSSGKINIIVGDVFFIFLEVFWVLTSGQSSRASKITFYALGARSDIVYRSSRSVSCTIVEITEMPRFRLTGGVSVILFAKFASVTVH